MHTLKEESMKSTYRESSKLKGMEFYNSMLENFEEDS